MHIIATISKNSYAPEKIEEILRAGATGLRFNFSHGDPRGVEEKITTARGVINKLGLQNSVVILADLPGNKIRLGTFPGGEYMVNKGDVVTFKSAEHSEDPRLFVPVDFDHIAEHIDAGQQVTVGDGEIGFEVINIIDNDTITARVLNSRHIPAMKGFNIGRSSDDLDHITDRTLEHLEYLRHIKPDWVAFSFINSGQSMRRASALLKKHTSKSWQPKIIAKLETPQAMVHLDDIVKGADMLMVARGDMGVTAPIEMLGIYQKQIVAAAKKAGKPVIVATQLLDSLLAQHIPSRAEVLDMTNIVLDGADAIMFAKETGISATPGYSVSVAKNIIEAVQKHMANANLNT